MNKLTLIAEQLRLRAELWLQRHGPWSLALAVIGAALLALALIVIPGLQAELAEKQNEQQTTLAELQTRARGAPPPAVPRQSASERHYQAFQQTLADDRQVLASIQAILDSAASHQLRSTRAEYQRGRAPLANAETLQMTVPLSGRYPDVRRWIEEILATQAFVAVNELAFKRAEIGLDEIEARVRLTIWQHPAKPSEGLRDVATDEAAR